MKKVAHPVICSICGKRFDRDVEQAVKTGARRYAHYKCKPDGELVPLAEKPEQNPDLAKLKEYISKKYGDKARWPLINKQIKDYLAKGYSLSGLLKSLIWFYDIKGNSIEKSNGGIGICEFAYQDAYNYYYSLFLAQSQNANKDIKEYTNKIKEVTIPLPQIKIPKRFFNLDDDEVEEE